MRYFKEILLIGTFLMVGYLSHGQYYYTEFGQNRIQYKKFDWYFYSTNNFEVYYYAGGHDYARQAMAYLEDEFTEITDILGYAPYAKTKIFIYNSIQDLQQSNIGIGGDVFTIGGKTDFVKLQVEIPYPGTSDGFKSSINQRLSRILIEDMMYGGSLAEIFQNAYLLSLPAWFMDGASRYLAYGWSDEMDDYVRDYLVRRKIKRFVKVQGEDAAILGQSIWNFIAVKYGESNISNILNLTRIIRNEENSIASTLGLSYKQFLEDWQNYYLLQEEEIKQNYITPDKENELTSSRYFKARLGHVKVNKTGNLVAYTYHKNGKFDVIVADLKSGRQQKVMQGGYLINGQEVDYNLPLIDWQADEILGILYYKRGDLILSTHNLSTGQKLDKPLERFNQVKSFSFNHNGKLAVLSGDIDGQNDIFLISMRRNALKRITDDTYDDIDPVFIPGTAAVIFSSNRKSDSVEVSSPSIQDIGQLYNLFLFDLDTSTTRFQRLTSTYGKDTRPIVKNEYVVYYLSDLKGINNVYKYSFLDSLSYQVSAYKNGIRDYDLSASSNNLSYIMLDDGREKVYVEMNPDLDQRIFTPQTGRKRLEQARMVVSKMQNVYVDPNTPLYPVEEKKPEVEVEDLKIPVEDSLLMPDEFLFEEDTVKKVDQTDASEIGEAEEDNIEGEDFIDINNYEFEDDDRPTFKPESFFSNYQKFEKKRTVVGPIAYEPRFSFSNVVTSAAVDPLRGFSFLVESEVSDILENHRLTGGLLATSDFKSGDIFAQYDYLKYWMDFRVRLDRKTYLFMFSPENSSSSDNESRQKYVLDKWEVSAAIPVSNTVRFEFSPFVAVTSFQNLQSDYVIRNSAASGFAKDNRTIYPGITTSMVIDNTIERGFNIHQGTRGIVEYSNYKSLWDDSRSFSKIKVDLRHYQKVHREITLATRAYFGKSMGNNRQKFLIGGMKNWIFQQYANQGTEDPLVLSNTLENSNILFTEFVTNLRGFDYNEAFGTNAFVFNAELRVPVFRYFSRGPIASNFLRNFQLVGFYDLGTAWNGKAPVAGHNAALTKKYHEPGSLFSAEIASFQNPWLAGYGWGLRTVLFGYYIKLDIAKPIQDYQIGSNRFYFTIGLDF
ncbi:outer membrane protein assembly factor [Marinoscillum sp. MHG1-6]|uniref:outer membrane protein assembly factor n=1 Tax=Marinoscillum sp. MHG1-6 TaxID=2959627 RepID=UPI002158776E|nr:outer membrane protein assembly factor [Marinoscillum sp. MHG1-6]